MPRTVTVLSGQQSQDAQIPVTLVELLIPGRTKRLHDLADEISLFLLDNGSAATASMLPGSGRSEFTPYAGLDVPEIEITDEVALSEVTFSVNNITDPATMTGDGEWYAIIAENQYRTALASIYQGNLTLPAGSSPFAATFVGAVKTWAGQIEHIAATRETATITLGPPMHPYGMKFPRRRYERRLYPRMRKAGEKFFFGHSEVTV